MRVIVDFRVPENDGWQEQAEQILRSALAEFGIISPADPSDSIVIMDAITVDMQPEDLANFKRSVRYIARQFSGPFASINVLRQGYVRLRLRCNDFGDLYALGQEMVTFIMQRYGPGTEASWRLSRCEIRERRGAGFLYGAWVTGYRNLGGFLFRERRAFFIAALFIAGLTLELLLTFVPVTALPADWNQLGLRLGAPMLVSSAVLLLEKYAQWLDQRSYRLVWSPRQRSLASQKLNIET